VSDLPLSLDAALAARLARSLDVEGKIPRALAALGPLVDRDVVLLDGSGGIRVAQLVEMGARVTVLSGPDLLAGRPGAGGAPADGWRELPGTAAATGLPDQSADAVVSCWSAFRVDQAAELAEAERLLRPGGRLLVLHDYGRDDVSRLRGEGLPEYTTWGRRDGWFLRTGFKVHVLHCWWTFDSIDDAAQFLETAFGDPGRTYGAGLRRPRLSYNVAIYHRTRA
jgi:SAM-dependent methyltransferase